MSTYVMSDIHGQLVQFEKILKQIKFNEERDKLYLLGDYVDWGDYSIELLQKLMAMTQNGSTKCLMGNHDKMMLNTINLILKGKSILRDNNTFVWFNNNGNETLEKYIELIDEDKNQIRYWLSHLEYTIDNLKIGDKQYYLCHSMPYFKGMVKNDILWDRVDEFGLAERMEKFYPGRTLISGHTIVKHYSSIADGEKCRIYKSKVMGYINIDCGAKSIGYRDYARLACLRLDDMEEFYED